MCVQSRLSAGFVLWCKSLGWLQRELLGQSLQVTFPVFTLFLDTQAPNSCLSGTAWECCGWPLPCSLGSSVAPG